MTATTKPIPKAVTRHLEVSDPAKYRLILLLDEKDAYNEVSADTAQGFKRILASYRKTTAASLRKSNCRFFIKTPRNITEIPSNDIL